MLFSRLFGDILDFPVYAQHDSRSGLVQRILNFRRNSLKRLSGTVHLIRDFYAAAFAVQILVKCQLYTGDAVQLIPVEIPEQMRRRQILTVPHRNAELTDAFGRRKQPVQRQRNRSAALQPGRQCFKLFGSQRFRKRSNCNRIGRHAHTVLGAGIHKRLHVPVVYGSARGRNRDRHRRLLIRHLRQAAVSQMIDFYHQTAEHRQQQCTDNHRAFGHSRHHPFTCAGRFSVCRIHRLPSGTGFP